MKIYWNDTKQENLYTDPNKVILKSTIKNGYKKLYKIDYTNAPQKELLEKAIDSIKHMFEIKTLYNNIPPFILKTTSLNSPLGGFDNVCFINNNGTEEVYVNYEKFISVIEEIIGIKLLRKNGFPLKNALSIINKNINKFNNWKIKFITDEAILIINPELEPHYLILPIIFNY